MDKTTFPAWIVFLSLPAFILSSCEPCTLENVTVLLPERMTATIIQGSSTSKLIADYHYIPGTGRLDHITWSNHQTHYFEYDVSGRLRVVRRVMVDTRVQEELWFHYEGDLVDRIIQVKRNLDYIYLEPLDSTCTGHTRFEFEGMRVARETRYETGDERVAGEVIYEYDGKGNIISSISSDPRTSTGESVHMGYDRNKHPLSGLQYYFTGESFVNNLLSKNMEEMGLEYSYELKLNEYGYPDVITEKLGAASSRITRYSYMTGQ
ncbi:MAG: hypothetical protein EHM46_06235 [Bacteroidetes bacterium]|nr:MAG: hypothetical protein EHM46_06235 [Bacteroidota bacterium]